MATKQARSETEATNFWLWIRVILLLALGFSTPELLTAQDCSVKIGADSIESALQRRLAWEQYWGEGSSDYLPADTVVLEMLAYGNEDVVGFCTSTRGYCAAYDRTTTSLGQLTARRKFPARIANDSELLDRFLSENSPDAVNWTKRRLERCRISVSSPGVMSNPSSKVKPSSAERLKKWIESKQAELGSRDRTCVHIPFYNDTDPTIWQRTDDMAMGS